MPENCCPGLLSIFFEVLVINEFPEIVRDKASVLRRLAELKKDGWYAADLHVHSAQSDGIHSLKTVVGHCLDLGISVAVTDHNRVPDLSALRAKEVACMIPAMEVTSREYVDILCYFDDFASLQQFNDEIVAKNKVKPYMISLSCEEILLSLENRKCVSTVPHPDYPADPLRANFMRLLKLGALSSRALSVIHCIEIFNAGRDTQISMEKRQLALDLDKYGVVGSDAHTKSAIADTLTFCKAKNHRDFLRKVATGQTMGIGVASRRMDKSLPKMKMAWLHIKGLLAGR